MTPLLARLEGLTQSQPGDELTTVAENHRQIIEYAHLWLTGPCDIYAQTRLRKRLPL